MALWSEHDLALSLSMASPRSEALGDDNPDANWMEMPNEPIATVGASIIHSSPPVSTSNEPIISLQEVKHDARPSIAMPMTATGIDESMYAGLSPRTRRRRKNRDQMRLARDRERAAMDLLRVTVDRLEAQYQQALATKQHATVALTAAPPVTQGSLLEGLDASARRGATTPTPIAYSRLIALSSQLKEENFELKQTLHEKHKLQETLERVVNDYIKPSAELDELLNDGDIALAPRITTSDKTHWYDAYVPLSLDVVWLEIAASQVEMPIVQHAIHEPRRGRGSVTLVQSSDDEGGHSNSSGHPSPSPSSSPIAHYDAPPQLPPFCGWEIRHVVDAESVYFGFEKTFPHTSTYQAMLRMWENELAMKSYRDERDIANQRLRVVQVLNDDTYVFLRRVVDPDSQRSVVSTYLRFRLKTPQGYLIGTKSIGDVDSQAERPGWASRICVWTEFRPFIGNAGCIVRITGRTNMEDPTHAQRDVAIIVIGLLRWENTNIGPVFTLTA